MWYSISGDDFRQARELEAMKLPEGNTWEFCSGYEPKKLPDHGKEPGAPEYFAYSIEPKHPRGHNRITPDSKNWQVYKPLEDRPDLFLEFARLYDKGFSIELVLNWVHRHGKLGCNRFAEGGAKENQETVRSFWGEVKWAAGVLALYEAVVNEDAERAQELAQKDFFFLSPHPLLPTRSWGSEWGGLSEMLGETDTARTPFDEYDELGYTEEWPRPEEEGEPPETIVVLPDAQEVAKYVDRRFQGDYLAYALETAVWAVTRVTSRYCFPTLRINKQPKEITHDPSRVGEIRDFENLLGAMYLQMYWLLQSPAGVKRCKYCRRIISLASPRPGARKTRSDKETCNKSCRQNYSNHKKKIEGQRQSAGRQS